MLNLVLQRLGLGVLTLFAASVLIFIGTEILPGDLASAILQNTATPESLAKLRLDRPRAEKLLKILLRENMLCKVNEDLIFHRSALRQLKELLLRRKAQCNRINVALFKEITGLSRKYAIPLLEYLDRERVTRREGDERIIL